MRHVPGTLWPLLYGFARAFALGAALTPGLARVTALDADARHA